MRIVLRDGGACNSVIYLQMNWHGDFYRGYSANGDSFTVQQGDELPYTTRLICRVHC